MENDFLIDEVAIHLKTTKRRSHHELVRTYFLAVIKFLQTNGLTTRTLLPDGAAVEDTLKIMRSDLTEEGYAVIKTCYDKWLESFDRGKSPSDTTMLEKALMKLRKK